MKTNIGRRFLRIVDDCFPTGHPLRRIFNRSSLKLSYGCMPNVAAAISAHNKNILSKKQSDERLCNCRVKDSCPLSNQCLLKGIVYQARVTTSGGASETYVGLTDSTFKARYSNHKQSFNKDKYRNQTELSKHVWKLKEEMKDFSISWTVLGQAQAYSNITKRCNLCTLEKYYIIRCKEKASLNKRSELASTCRHANKFILENG